MFENLTYSPLYRLSVISLTVLGCRLDQKLTQKSGKPESKPVY